MLEGEVHGRSRYQIAMAQVPELAEIQSEESRSLLPEGSRTPGVSFGVRSALLIGASLLLVTGWASYSRTPHISPDGIMEAAGFGIIVGSRVQCAAAWAGGLPMGSNCKVASIDGQHVDVDCHHGNNVLYYFRMADCKLVSGGGSCTADGEDCRKSQCCTNAGSVCFKKNDYWASCNATCSPNMLWEGGHWVDKGAQHNWDCQVCSKTTCDPSVSDRPSNPLPSPPRPVPLPSPPQGGGGFNPGYSPACDISSCGGASGEQAQLCRETLQRNCCLAEACKGAQGEQVDKCYNDQLAVCCAGKSPQCSIS